MSSTIRGSDDFDSLASAIVSSVQADSGCIEFGNGLAIQWVNYAPSASLTFETIPYVKTFSTIYSVSGSRLSSAPNAARTILLLDNNNRQRISFDNTGNHLIVAIGALA